MCTYYVYIVKYTTMTYRYKPILWKSPLTFTFKVLLYLDDGDPTIKIITSLPICHYTTKSKVNCKKASCTMHVALWCILFSFQDYVIPLHWAT